MRSEYSTAAKEVKICLQQVADVNCAIQIARFFKTGKGQYAERDKFLGIAVPILRQFAKQFHTLPISGLKELLSSPFNEERLLALIILVNRYKEGGLEAKEEIYQLYLHSLNAVNNWNLVDASAPYILGAHLLDKDKDILWILGQSSLLWERRVAIVSTLHFIKHSSFEESLKLAQLLLEDPHDLIHKAVGWVLREVGKKDLETLETFLDKHNATMPRTMLRYAIEKMPTNQRLFYLGKKIAPVF